MKKVIALTGGLIVASGMAFAGEGMGKMDKASFTDLDKDGDGAISRTEASNHEGLMSHFSDADRNRDGQLSRTEFTVVEPELEEAE